jgi:hypothetical protein
MRVDHVDALAALLALLTVVGVLVWVFGPVAALAAVSGLWLACGGDA